LARPEGSAPFAARGFVHDPPAALVDISTVAR